MIYSKCEICEVFSVILFKISRYGIGLFYLCHYKFYTYLSFVKNVWAFTKWPFSSFMVFSLAVVQPIFTLLKENLNILLQVFTVATISFLFADTKGFVHWSACHVWLIAGCALWFESSALFAKSTIGFHH